jgi:hypothetical protein
MSYSDPAIEEFYSLSGKEFGILERLELVRPIDPNVRAGVLLNIDLRAALSADSPRMRLSFHGVRDLQIGEIVGLLRYMINIRSLRGSQLEDLNYKVVESEYQAFSFVCKDFTASIE